MAGTRPAYSAAPVYANTRESSSSLLKLALFFAALATLLSPYVEWRPAEVFVTTSDILFMIAAALLMSSGHVQTRPFGPTTLYWLSAYVIMILGLFIGSVMNGDPVRWLVAAAQYGFGLVLLPFVFGEPGSDRRALVCAKAMIAGVVLMEAFGAAIFYGYEASYQEYQKISENFITGGGRLGAFVGQPNWNAAVIAMALPFAFYLRARGQLSLISVYVTGAVLALGLVLSASFTGFVSALIVLFLFLIVGGTRQTLKAALVLAVAGAVLLASGFELPEVFQGRVGEALETGDMSQAGTFTGRMDLILEAWEIVEDTMFVGIGVDQYRVVSPTQVPVHNMYLLLWAEGGLLALLGWMLLLTIAGVSVVRVYWVDRQAAALGLSVLSTFLIFSVASPHMYARMWMVPLVLALVIVLGKLSSPNNAHQ